MRRFSQSTLNDQRELFNVLSEMSTEIERLQDAQRTAARGGPQMVELNAMHLGMIRDALQVRGTHPLNVAQLVGILAQSQRGYAVLAASAGVLPSPVLFEVGTLGIVTTAPIALYYVSEGTPRAWTGPVSLPVTPHALLGPSHSDAATQTATRGSLIKANSTPAWDEFVLGTALQLIRVNAAGNDLEYGAVDDSMLSANVALENVANVFSVGQTISSLIGLSLGGGSGPTLGAQAQFVWATEHVTLSTSGTTTDTVSNLIPANCLVVAVLARVTTSITTAATLQFGDSVTPARFGTLGSMGAPSTIVCLNHHQGSVSTDAAGPVQFTAIPVRLTANVTPGAGVVRVAVLALQFTAPTS